MHSRASRSTLPATRPATGVAWARSVRRFARIGLWTLPVYAVVFGYATLRYGGTDAVPPGPADLLLGLGGTWLGLVALVALVAVLAGSRGRVFSLTGLLVGLGAAAILLPISGLSGVPRPALGWAMIENDAAALNLATGGYGPATHTLWLTGVGLYSLSWMLLGVAVLTSHRLNRVDGVLLILAGPLLGTLGLSVPTLRTVGAILLLAAGIGVAWSASRLAPAPVAAAQDGTGVAARRAVTR